jgi:hypothetical protein
MILGHAHVSTTMQIYTDVDDEARSHALTTQRLAKQGRLSPLLMSEIDVSGQSQDRCREETPGGAKGTRTPDPLLAKQVLFQLSYSPRKPHLMRLLGILAAAGSPCVRPTPRSTRITAGQWARSYLPWRPRSLGASWWYCCGRRRPCRCQAQRLSSGFAVVFIVAADPHLETIAFVTAFRRAVKDRVVAHQEFDSA